ncbi:MAG: hypothetical protein Q4A27_01965 [bacterium]|nr:hypothetical protein [bacterium]
MTDFLIFTLMVMTLFFWLDTKEGDSKLPLISKSRNRVLVDTSILIDGRFLAVARTGFIDFEILIPRSVVGELQILADGGDDEKRVRARFGLDIISALQNEQKVNVSILADGNSAKEGVDNRLISLAKKMNAKILTADYNLNKVAKVEGIEVLNINELVQSVRAQYLPGEKIMLEITSHGNEKKQGVGHLSDGTMVVVEGAENLIGTTAEVEFIRTLQTAAGKMMFAKLVGAKTAKSDNSKNKGRAPVKSKAEKPAKNAQVAISKSEKAKNEVRKSVSKKVAKAATSKKVSKKPAVNSKTKTVKSEQNSKTKTAAKPKRRTQKSAEASLVSLANRQSE